MNKEKDKVKRILTTTGYMPQVEKTIVYLYIEELENKVNQLETNRDEAIDLIYSNVVANGEIIDQLRKIEVKRILEILERGKEC